MNEEHQEKAGAKDPEIRSVIRDVIQEFLKVEQSRAEPAYKTELVDEKKRREQLERRVNELVEENRRAQKAADEAQRSAAIRAELQRLGVAKVDLAFKAVKDDITRMEDGRLVARSSSGDVSLKEFLAGFVNENPELLPARMAGGSGAGATQRDEVIQPTIDLDKIRPGMKPEELERVRAEVARLASQTIRGY